ncbi:MAG: hypothetical protein MZV63_25715 [Marinilabiliales bacterium]|nr:hypothetical protein [Marinilabiliales bacterium]
MLAEQKFEEKFSKTEALAANGKLYLSNISGEIAVATWKEAQVKIEAVKTSKASTLEKAKENAALGDHRGDEGRRSRPRRNEISEEERRLLGRQFHQRLRGLQDLGARDGRGRAPFRQRRRRRRAHRREGQDRLRQRQRRPPRRGRSRGQARQRGSDPGEHRRGRVHQGGLREHRRNPDQGLSRSRRGERRHPDDGRLRGPDGRRQDRQRQRHLHRRDRSGRPLRAEDAQRRRPDVHPRRLGLRLRGQHLQRRHRHRFRDQGRRQDLAEGDPRHGRQGRGDGRPPRASAATST